MNPVFLELNQCKINYILLQTEIKSESTEDFYAPSTIIFHDIYTNSLATATDEDASTTTVTEDYSVDNKHAQFVEFHPLITTEKPTIPPPRYILDATMLINSKVKQTTTTTTEEPEDIVKVVPVKQYQRGLLDLLFPPKRVETFKNVFDSIRHVLSYTFR